MSRSATALVVDARKAFDAGIGTYIRQVVPRVAEQLGTAVAALVPAGQNVRYGWLTHAGVTLIEMHATPMSVAEQFELRSAIGPARCFWATSMAHSLWGLPCPLVATVHDVAQLALPHSEMGGAPWLRAAVSVYARSLQRQARALLTISRFTEGEFLRLVGAPLSGQMTVTHLGVDPSWFMPADARPEQQYLICLGSVRPHKNVERLLQAYARAAPRVPHRLRIVGRLPEDGTHLRWQAALPEAVRPRVLFEGAVSDAALRSIVAGADALLFPSLYEGFGLPVLEAMAAGCPVAASRAGALPEVCGDAAAATFDPRDVSDMALAIEAVASMSSAARERAAERGRAHAARYVWDATAEKTVAVLRSVLDEGPHA